MGNDIYGGHAESCHALSPGDRECNCHKIQGFNSAEEMEEAGHICPSCKGSCGFWWNATCAHQEWVNCEECKGTGRKTP